MVTLKDLYDKVRAYERDEDDQGAFSNDVLFHHFDMAWRRAHEIMARNQIPCVSGWISKYVPAYANRIRLYSYGALKSIDVVEEKQILAYAPIISVAWDERGTIITVPALTDLLTAGLVTGKQVTVLGLPGSMGIEGEFTIVVDETNQDQSLLIPGLETRGIPAKFPLGGLVVYSTYAYATIYGTDGSAGFMHSGISSQTGSDLAFFQQNPYRWSNQTGTIEFTHTDYPRVIRMRGTFGVESPKDLDDEIPEQLVSTLVPATVGYATLGINRQRGLDILRDAFGTDDVIGGALGQFIDNQMKGKQTADVVRRNIDYQPNPWFVV